jgi:FixJ family two-component response regulator
MNRLDNPSAITWFAKTTDIINRVAHLSQGLKIEQMSLFEQCDDPQLDQLPPGNVVVIELDEDETHANPHYLNTLSKKLELVRRQGKLPTLVCIGNGVPSEIVVDWMRNGIFVYAERSSATARLVDLLMEANRHADDIRTRYNRYLTMRSFCGSISQRESIVLDMLLLGIPNKTIATRLVVSLRTVEVRRQKLYKKLQSNSIAGVVQTICEWNVLKQQFEEPTLANESGKIFPAIPTAVLNASIQLQTFDTQRF